MEKRADSIGSLLKRARTRQGASLDDVYGKTRIHPRILLALEEDRGEEVLSGTYLKAFLKDYSRHLGVADDESIKCFLEKKPTAEEKPQEKKAEKKEKPAIDIKKHAPQAARIAVVIILIYTISLAGLRVISGVKKLFARRVTAAVVAPSVPQVKKEAAPTAEKPKAGFRAIPKNEELLLKVEAVQDVWLEVKADEKIVFRRILSKGSVETWKARDSLRLWLGNADAARLSLNGQALDSPGRGVVKNIVLTKDGMSVKK